MVNGTADEHRDWSRLEVEATVQAYLEMLRLELAGIPFNKAERRRALLQILDRRSEGAVERKHQNISAILIEMGLPYVDGYKPLGNVQGLLREIVHERIESAPDLVKQVAAVIEQPVHVPNVDDILSALIEKPRAPETSGYRYVSEPRRIHPQQPVDYLLREASNSALGRAGEEFALRFEQARLIAARQERLAAAVEHVARTRGAYLGFDILSFDQDGRERLIEVKTTGFGAYTPFFVTANELRTSHHEGPRFHLYRLFKFRQRPQLFSVAGQLDQTCRLEPATYVGIVN